MGKILNKFSLSNLTLLTALSLSTIAAYYSIMGLIAIFSAAVIPIIVMGSILEVGKIVTTVWLRKYWHRCGWVLKCYLVPAVVLLAFLTSMGIFGFLSKAHSDQSLVSGDVLAKISIYDEKIKTAKENIDANRKALKQMDEAVDQVMGRSTTETGAERSVQIRRQQGPERQRLIREIEAEQKKISALNEERAPVAAEVRKVEAEVGPIKYIAAFIYNDNPDANLLERAVRWVIILIVIVFDPLAIALVLAANASKDWDKEEPKYEKDDGPLNDDQLKQLQDDVAAMNINPEPPDVTIRPFTEEEIAALDKDKDIWPFPDPIKEGEESILNKHPYLNEPFKHFEDLKPIVAEKEKLVDEKILDTYNDERLVSNYDKEQLKKEVTTDSDANIMAVKQELPYRELSDGYVAFNGKHMSKDALFASHPEFLRLTEDAKKPVKSGFGIQFPQVSEKGDVFTRVDILPNKVYKYDGRNWIEINKNTTNTYLYNTKYLEYLIDKIEKGEYDPELLNDNERYQIEDYIKIQKINNQNS